MSDLDRAMSRRALLRFMGATAGAVAAWHIAPTAAHGLLGSPAGEALPEGAPGLATLTQQLAKAPRRRGFARVPFLLDQPELWDHEAAAHLLAYRGKPRQVWENSEIAAAWINLMREAVNGQVFSHRHADFLAVSATHGTAHLALFNQAMWDKYGFAERTSGLATRNTFIIEKAGTSPADDHHDIAGFYGVANNNIVSLQRRGMVFVGCHDSIHAIARSLQPKTGKDADEIAADLTNNLIAGVVLVPSVVAFLGELQEAGYGYAKGA